uniref:cytochrome b n=1 Tax=Docophoroides brevis TaxID=160119 RepID=UPI00211F0FD9|nr:cytochrome b [Docophoroides brevis]UTT72592.1 cytochrome b [Docophoroides brevis]
MLNMKNINNMVNSTLTMIPTPSSITYMWSFGSLLGVCLVIQIVSGLFLSMHYNSATNMAFDSVVHIVQDINWGWLIRNIHANGASFFFIFIYLHIGRGIYYMSYYLMGTWIVGIAILLALMATAFLGYVLPWGQMSFWGATVITNLLSAVPYLGDTMVIWLWGGFSVGNPTLVRFFSFHFILPFVIIVLVLMHLVFLHSTGSSNPLGVPMNSLKVYFHPYFSIKDLLGFVVFFILFMYIILIKPDVFMDPDNFSLANPMNTPPHIQPEWYFLFAYAILRSIPNKLGGVIALLSSILILGVIPFISSLKVKTFNFKMRTLFWFQVMNFMLLTWLGSMPVEYPYETVSQFVSVFYFLLFIVMNLIKF